MTWLVHDDAFQFGQFVVHALCEVRALAGGDTLCPPLPAGGPDDKAPLLAGHAEMIFQFISPCFLISIISKI